jgi:hypothetical protein
VVMVPVAWAVFRDRPEDCGLVMDGGSVKRTGSVNRKRLINPNYP